MSHSIAVSISFQNSNPTAPITTPSTPDDRYTASLIVREYTHDLYTAGIMTSARYQHMRAIIDVEYGSGYDAISLVVSSSLNSEISTASDSSAQSRYWIDVSRVKDSLDLDRNRACVGCGKRRRSWRQAWHEKVWSTFKSLTRKRTSART
jgi:hypothetical protein